MTNFADADWSAETFGPDSEVYCTIPVLPGVGNIIYMGVRINGPNTASMNGYDMSVTQTAGASEIRISRIDSGVENQIANDCRMRVSCILRTEGKDPS